LAWLGLQVKVVNADNGIVLSGADFVTVDRTRFEFTQERCAPVCDKQEGQGDRRTSAVANAAGEVLQGNAGHNGERQVWGTGSARAGVSSGASDGQLLASTNPTCTRVLPAPANTNLFAGPPARPRRTGQCL